jgi:cytochrome c
MKLIAFALAGVLVVGGPAYAQEETADAGAVVFRKCMGCHQVGLNAQHSVGPILNGTIGRPAGTHPGYNYSPATRNSGLVWDEQTLMRYLRSPRDLVPGTRMAFAGLKDDRDIASVIAYLKQFDEEGRKIHQ